MSGEGNNFIRDDNVAGSKTHASGDESAPKSAHNLSDGGEFNAASGGSSAAETRGDKGRATLKEDTRVRLAMAPQDKPALVSLELTPSKFSDKALEKPNRFKELFDVDKPSTYAITMKDGKEVLTARPPLKEGEKLASGDYLISFHKKDKQPDKDGKLDTDGKPGTDRQLRLHIPKPNPEHADAPMSVVFAMHGVMPFGLSPAEFAKTVPLADEADKTEDPFIVAWPIAAINSAGDSKSSFWVADNTPVRAEDVEKNAKRLGYKDGDFIAALPELIKKNTNAASTDTWSIAGHSLGGALAHQSLCDSRLAGVFPNAFIIHSTMMTDKEGAVIADKLASGNARNVVFFHPKDNLILPEKNAAAGRALNNLVQGSLSVFSSVKKNTEKQLATDAAKDSLTSRIHGLASAASKPDVGLAMDNVHQDPLAQIDHYLGLLGPDIQRYQQLPKNNNQQLKQPKDFQERVPTQANFSPNAHGPIDTIWSAQSLTTGKTLTVVDNQGGHIPAGRHPKSYHGLDAAATIAHYHRQFNKQKHQLDTDLVSGKRK